VLRRLVKAICLYFAETRKRRKEDRGRYALKAHHTMRVRMDLGIGGMPERLVKFSWRKQQFDVFGLDSG
jgi:hypothetical protein